jgi:nucleotide-binding universal stress UspA family protein
VYSHILVPTDGSELSKMALYEGVALAKALGARVSAVTVTTPFHVFTRTPRVLDRVDSDTDESRFGAGAQNFLFCGGETSRRQLVHRTLRAQQHYISGAGIRR